MNTIAKVAHVVLEVLTGFLALIAFVGGLGLLTGLYAPPQEYLRGLFPGYLIPALLLFVLVGGSALLAFILLLRKSDVAVLCAAISGIVVMFFEFVEVQVIGAPAGPAQALQLFYFGLGTLIILIAFSIWLATTRAQSI